MLSSRLSRRVRAAVLAALMVVSACAALWGAGAGPAQAEPALTSDGIYWADLDANLIGRMDTGGGALVAALIDPGDDLGGGIAVDDTYVYWTLWSGGIGRAKLNGDDVETDFITGAGDSPTAIAVDGSHIYWTDANNAHIGRADIDGDDVDPTFIATDPDGSPDGIAVTGDHLYWADANQGTIGRASLDGSVVDPDFVDGLDTPHYLAVDATHLYWTDFATNSIGRVELDGDDPELDYWDTGGDRPYGLAVLDGALFWTSPLDSAVRVRLPGSDDSFNVPAGELLYPMGLAVTGPAFASDPGGELDYGPVVSGTSSSQTVTVTNTAVGGGARPLHVGAVAIDGTDADAFSIADDTCSGAAVVPGATCTVTVSFAPTERGSHEAYLTFADDAPSSGQDIHLLGHGTAVDAAIDPTGGAFGNVATGTVSPTQTFTVTNTVTGADTDALRLGPDAVVLGGGGADQFQIVSDGCAGAALAPSEQCTVAVAFAPTAAGDHDATLTVTGAGAPPVVATLSGTGTTPPQPPDDDGTTGPAGPTGPTGPTTPSGPTGPGTPAPPSKSGGPSAPAPHGTPKLGAPLGGPMAVVTAAGALRARCALSAETLRRCTVTVRGAHWHGTAHVRPRTGRRATLVRVRLGARGRAAVRRALGGVRVTVTVVAVTRDGKRVTRRVRALLLAPRQRIVTAPGAFPPNGATLTAIGKADLRAIAHRLRGARAVICTGYTATIFFDGDGVFADQLGLARARTACAALRRLGVHARMTLRSGGRGTPRASNLSEAGRARNRRVELTILRRAHLVARGGGHGRGTR